MASKYANNANNINSNVVSFDEWVRTVIMPSIANMDSNATIIGVNANGASTRYTINEACLIVKAMKHDNLEIYCEPIGVSGLHEALVHTIGAGLVHKEIARVEDECKKEGKGAVCTVVPLGRMKFDPAPDLSMNTNGTTVLTTCGAMYTSLRTDHVKRTLYDVVQMLLGAMSGVMMSMTDSKFMQEQMLGCHVIVHLAMSLAAYFRNYQDEFERVRPLILDANPRDINQKIILHVFFMEQMTRPDLLKTIYTAFARLAKRKSLVKGEARLLSEYRGPMMTMLMSFTLARMIKAKASVEEMNAELEKEMRALLVAMTEVAAPGNGAVFTPMEMNRAIATQLFTAARIDMTDLQIESFIKSSLNPRKSNFPTDELMVELGMYAAAATDVDVSLDVKTTTPVNKKAAPNGGATLIGNEPRSWTGFRLKNCGTYILTAARNGKSDMNIRFTCGNEALPKNYEGYSVLGTIAQLDGAGKMNYVEDKTKKMVGVEDGTPITLAVGVGSYTVSYGGVQMFSSIRNPPDIPVVVAFKGCSITIHLQPAAPVEEKEDAPPVYAELPLAEKGPDEPQLSRAEMAKLTSAGLIQLLSAQAGR